MVVIVAAVVAGKLYIDGVLLLFLLRQHAPVTATGNAPAALCANYKELAAIAATELRARDMGNESWGPPAGYGSVAQAECVALSLALRWLWLWVGVW